MTVTSFTSRQNPDLMPDLPVIDPPELSEINFPSSSGTSSSSSGPSTASSATDLPNRTDQYGYSQPFAATKNYLDRRGRVMPDGGVTPQSRGEFSTGLPSNYAASSKAPSEVPSSKASSSKTVSTKSNLNKPVGGYRVLPPGPVPSLSPIKTPRTPASQSSKKSATPHGPGTAPRSKVPTPAPSIKPHVYSPVLTKGSRTGTKPKAKSPHQTIPLPAKECHISVDDKPDIPLKAKIPKNIDGSKWLNHRPIENFDEASVLKPNLEKKRTVAIPDVDDFDDETNRYLLQHQEQDSIGEIRTHFIKGDIKVSRGGGRCVEFTDIETSSVKPSAKEAYGKGCNVYPPPVADSGDWTDTETRCAVGVGIPTAKTKPPTHAR